MAEELSKDEVFANDVDPLDAIAQIRKEEGVEDKDLPFQERDSADSSSADAENTDNEDDLAAFEDDKEKSEGEATATNTDEDPAVDKSDDTPDNNNNDDDKGTTDEQHTQETDEKTSNEDGAADGEQDSEKEKEGITAFRANGQDFEFTDEEIKAQFGTVFGQAMNYTQKMQQIAPYRKMISALEKEGVTQEQLNIAIDALKGDAGALKELMTTNKIDPFDLRDAEGDEKSPYTPNEYGASDLEMQISEVTDTIAGDDEYPITFDIIQNQWDDNSKEAFASNPQLISALHGDVKSGVYDEVAPAAMKMKVLDGNKKSDIEYYMIAGSQRQEKLDANKEQDTTAQQTDTVDKLNKQTQDAEAKFDQESSEADKKRSAATTRQRADRKGVIDYLDDDDEAFDAWYKNLQASN